MQNTTHNGEAEQLAKMPGPDRSFAQPKNSSNEPSVLQAIMNLFNSTAYVPRDLFPAGAKVTKSVRLKQLVYGFARFFSLKLCGKQVAVIHGESLAYLSGWATFSLVPSVTNVLASLKRGQPIIPICIGEDNAAKIYASLNIDAASELNLFFSQNGYILLRAQKCGKACIVHYGYSQSGRTAIVRHTTGLLGANARLAPVLGDLLPEIWARHPYGSAEVMVQREIQGSTPCVAMLNKHQLAALTEAGLNPLRKIYRIVGTRTQFGGGFIEMELARLLTAMPEYQAHLAPALKRLHEWVVNGDLEVVPTHGDYAPRNMLFGSDYSQVTGIVDWEWFWDNGIAGFDALKFLLEVRAETEGKTLIETLGEFLGDPEQAAADTMRPITDLYSLSPYDLWHLALFIWLRILWMGCVITTPTSQKWLDNAVLVPAQAFESSVNAIIEKRGIGL